MAKQSVTVWLGTRKGTYAVESDVHRKTWKVRGPYHEGQDAYHVIADPRTPGSVYALLNSAWWGPMVSHSKDNGRKWSEVAPPMTPMSKDRTRGESGAVTPGPVVNLWHLTPGPENEPGSLFLGIDPASLFRSDDSGKSWTGLAGLNEHETRPKWNPGAGGMCLHTILLDPDRPKRMYAGISAAGVFRSDDAGEHWTPYNKGVVVSFQPEKRPVVGQCVHKIALDSGNSTTVYRQDHDGIYVSHNSAESWTRVGRPLETDFGFVVTAPAAMPGEALFAPLHGMARTGPNHQLQVYKWTDRTKKWTPTVRGKPWMGDLGMHREGLDSDSLDPAGIYLGTTTGNLFVSADGANTWREVPYHFPSIHSVAVSSPSS